MQRVLFYLPVVTPWWFDNIVVHMIRALSACAEVHVLVPPLWRNTGIGPEQLNGAASIQGVYWHIADEGDHRSLRTAPADADGLLECVRSIDPAYVFCRSADIATPARFPGKICHLMEAGAPPLSTRAGWVTLQRDFWHHGAMPDLADEDRREIEGAFAPVWKGLRNRTEQVDEFRLPRAKALQRMGLPEDRRIIALPLEYEHHEAFTAFHNGFERNLDLIRYVAAQAEGDWIIAVSDHPLNYKHVDNSAVYEEISALGDRVRLVPNPRQDGWATGLLTKHCDGLIVQNTKAIYSGALFGKPILRLSNRPTAGWLGAHREMATFKAAVAQGAPEGARERFRLWLGYHTLHEIIDPTTISGAEILDRIERPFSRERLAAGLHQYKAHQRALALAA
jgi:hypothetical protein